jgi:hypothetical protein
MVVFRPGLPVNISGRVLILNLRNSEMVVVHIEGVGERPAPEDRIVLRNQKINRKI